MTLVHEDETNRYHYPIYLKGRMIQTNGEVLVSRAHAEMDKTQDRISTLVSAAMEDTRAPKQLPDIVISPHLLKELVDEMGGTFIAIWVGSEPMKPVVIRCEDNDAYGILMPMRIQDLGPLDIGDTHADKDDTE